MTARAVLLLVSVDLPAQAKLLNMKQYNGAYGCHACEDEGVPQSECPTSRDWPCITPRSPLRTHELVIRNASEATRCSSVVRQLYMYIVVCLINYCVYFLATKCQVYVYLF